MRLLNGMGFFEKITTIVDIIPKVIYFLYAALASGVDALQALIRKLAGLDTYWVTTGTGGESSAVTGRDPLTEFVYGILGVGESASVYKALNTVFWSLAIFGLIMLVVSTMIAIIKSHYNEDTAGTSPWKYIYTAVKSVLTFAVIPLVVILGMKLSTFALTTLDNIVAGSSDEGAITGVYGSSAATVFDSDENGTYTHYDFFGARAYTTNTPFSGMLFKAAGYNSNRIRNESMTKYADLKVGGTQVFGAASDTSTDYVAYQVDYAFSNCLMFKEESRPNYSEWVDYVTSNNDVRIWNATDIFKLRKIDGFSKWDVSMVWMFYDLWQFNYIVGFAGVTACFGIMVSIVFGLMSRLIKGAALFLIFPALLGIAPMDNFKAFKGWGSQFMQQVLMVFGAILGMNILLLILPYMQNINFFQIGILNAIMNVVILIVGLQMVKDFINIVNGFVGGADAVGAGDSVKEGTKKSLLQGAKMTLGAGKIGAMGVVGIGKGAYAVGKSAVTGTTNALTSLNAVNRARHREEAANKAIGASDESDEKLRQLREQNADTLAYYRGEKPGDGNSELYGKRIADAGEEARAKAQKAGLSADAVESEVAKAKDKEFNNILKEAGYFDKNGGAQVLADAEAKSRRAHSKADKATNRLQHTIDAHGLVYEDGDYKRTQTKGQEVKANLNGIIKNPVINMVGKGTTYKKDEHGNYVRDDKGRKVVETQGTGLKGVASEIGKAMGGVGHSMADNFSKAVSWNGIGKNIADGFSKSVNNMASTFGFDKLGKDLNGVVGTLKQTTFKKPDSLAGLEGDKLAKKTAEEQKSRDEKMQELLTKIVENTKPKDS